MSQLAINFLNEKNHNYKNLQKSNAAEIRDEFTDYIFRIYFLSYIKKSITYSSLQLKKKDKLLKEKEDLCLNVLDSDFNEERINVISDNTSMYFGEFSYEENDNYSLSEAVQDEDLIKAINILTDRQKEILFQSVIIGLTDTEIAKTLGISKQAVGKSKNSSIAKLKAILKKA